MKYIRIIALILTILLIGGMVIGYLTVLSNKTQPNIEVVAPIRMQQEVINIFEGEEQIGYEVITAVFYDSEVIWYETDIVHNLDSIQMYDRRVEAMEIIIAIEQIERLSKVNLDQHPDSLEFLK